MHLKLLMAVISADSQGIADIAVQVAEMTRNSQSSRGKDKRKTMEWRQLDIGNIKQ